MKKRCTSCRVRLQMAHLGVEMFTCTACERLFCLRHLQPRDHDCPVDTSRPKLVLPPAVVAPKVPPI